MGKLKPPRVTADSEADGKPQQPKTQFDVLIDKAKNNKVIALILVAGVAVIAFAGLTEAIVDLGDVFSGMDERSYYRGRVYKPDGSPFADAKIAAPGTSVRPVYSDSSGEFILELPVEIESVRLEVSADGYISHKKFVQRPVRMTDLVMLQRLPEGALKAEQTQSPAASSTPPVLLQEPKGQEIAGFPALTSVFKDRNMDLVVRSSVTKHPTSDIWTYSQSIENRSAIVLSYNWSELNMSNNVMQPGAIDSNETVISLPPVAKNSRVYLGWGSSTMDLITYMPQGGTSR